MLESCCLPHYQATWNRQVDIICGQGNSRNTIHTYNITNSTDATNTTCIKVLLYANHVVLCVSECFKECYSFNQGNTHMWVSMGDSVNDTEGSGALQRGANKKKDLYYLNLGKQSRTYLEQTRCGWQYQTSSDCDCNSYPIRSLITVPLPHCTASTIELEYANSITAHHHPHCDTGHVIRETEGPGDRSCLPPFWWLIQQIFTVFLIVRVLVTTLW